MEAPPKDGAAAQPELEVAHERLAGHQELVHEDVPRSDLDASRGREPPEPLGVLGAYLEVVVDDGHLPVEQVPLVGGVGLHEIEQLVHELDEAQTERLERLVPLAVPVRVGNDVRPGVSACRQCRHVGGVVDRAAAGPDPSRMASVGLARTWLPQRPRPPRPPRRPRTATLRRERSLLRDGHQLVGGLDEVGRGAWAGPMFVGVVVVDADTKAPPKGTRDSKLLTSAARSELSPLLQKWCVGWAHR